MSESSPLKSEKRTRATSFVNWLQSLKFRNDVPLVSGLDSVVFGTMAASQVVKIYNIQPPQYFWYMISGGICDILQFLVDAIMHIWVDNASTCWAVCFTLSILFRHSTHRYLVFGNYVGGYWNSLLRMYCGYSVSIVLSTAFNVIVTKRALIGHYPAFLFTLLWTGIVNFFILKKLWSFNGGKSTTKASPRTNHVGESTDDVELASLTENDDRLTR